MIRVIVDSIENRKNYRELPAIARALEYLSGMTADNMPKTQVLLDGDSLMANPSAVLTKPAEECVFEAHRQYIDVHYIVSGVEGIAVSPAATLAVTKMYDGEKDVEFLEGEGASTSFLSPGMFMVCFPQDAHRPSQMKDAPGEVVKIVMKVRAPADCL